MRSSYISLEYYESGFWASRVEAAMDALQELRPMGWEAVAKLEKLWLQSLYKQFLVEGAAALLRAQEQ